MYRPVLLSLLDATVRARRLWGSVLTVVVLGLVQQYTHSGQGSQFHGSESAPTVVVESAVGSEVGSEVELRPRKLLLAYSCKSATRTYLGRARVHPIVLVRELHRDLQLLWPHRGDRGTIR